MGGDEGGLRDQIEVKAAGVGWGGWLGWALCDGVRLGKRGSVGGEGWVG